jgi:hypothetical protein
MRPTAPGRLAQHGTYFAVHLPMNQHHMTTTLAAIFGILALATGCSSTREIEVHGTVATNACLTCGSIIRRLYFTEPTEAADQPPDVLASTRVPGFDTFDLTVEMHGETLVVYAYNDNNDNGSCEDGELSTSQNVVVGEDQDAVNVDVHFYDARSYTCPAFLSKAGP